MHASPHGLRAILRKASPHHHLLIPWSLLYWLPCCPFHTPSTSFSCGTLPRHWSIPGGRDVPPPPEKKLPGGLASVLGSTAFWSSFPRVVRVAKGHVHVLRGSSEPCVAWCVRKTPPDVPETLVESPNCAMAEADTWSEVRAWLKEHKLRTVGTIWAVGVAGSLAYSWAKPIPPSLKLIHSRVYAQAITVGALGAAALVDLYERHLESNTHEN